jgi:hypothetical protein
VAGNSSDEDFVVLADPSGKLYCVVDIGQA